jgi:hypothetical protein
MDTDKILAYLTSDHGMTVVSFWISILAILVGAVGIWRAERLFDELNGNVKELITSLKNNMLKEAETVFASYASFVRSLQAVDLKPHELPQDGAFALLTVFRIQQLLNRDFSSEQIAELRKQTRTSVEKAAHSYVEMLTKSGLATMKPNVRLNDLP